MTRSRSVSPTTTCCSCRDARGCGRARMSRPGRASPRDRARGADRVREHGHRDDGADGRRDGPTRGHRRRPSLPLDRGGGCRGTAGQALSHARRGGAVRGRVRADSRPGSSRGRSAWLSRGFLVVGPERRLLGLLTARDMLAGRTAIGWSVMTPRERLVIAPPGIELAEARRLLTAAASKSSPRRRRRPDRGPRSRSGISRSPTATPRATRRFAGSSPRRRRGRDPRRLSRSRPLSRRSRGRCTSCSTSPMVTRRRDRGGRES